jgi:hypothetical protein
MAEVQEPVKLFSFPSAILLDAFAIFVFGLTLVLEIVFSDVREAQLQNGLRHNDYPQYR